jgi:PAS domain S-box-containing protein
MKIDSSSSSYMSQEIHFRIIEKLRKRFPTNNFFIFFLIILKFIGILVITHSGIAYNSDNKSNSLNNPSSSNFSTEHLAYYLRRVLYMQSIFSNMKSYSALCFLIYTFILVTLIFLIIFWTSYAQNYEKKKFLKKEKQGIIHNIVIHSITFMINLIVLFSQHLLEILSIIFVELYLSLTYKSQVTNQNDSNFINVSIFIDLFESNLLLNKYFFCILNFIFMVILNCICYFYFKYLNEPFVCSNYNMKYSTNKNFNVILILLSNLTGIHYIDIFFPNSSNIKIILLIICFVLLIFHLFFYSKYVIVNLINCMILSISLYCLVSILFEFSIYFTKNENVVSLKISFLRLIIEGSLAIVFCLFFLIYKKRKNLRPVAEVIFHRSKVMSLESLSELISILKKGVVNCKDLNEIFRIINKHRNICKDKNCPCPNYEIENFLGRFKIRGRSRTTHDDHIIKVFQDSFHELILLVENEITKAIYNISNRNLESLDHIEDFLILHLDFILYFRRKTQLCVYFKNRYSRLKIKNYMFHFYLHLLEESVIKIEKDSVSHRQENYFRDVKYLDIFNYINLLTTLQNLMTKNLDNYENLLKFKNIYNNKVLKGNMRVDKVSNLKINAEHLLNTCLDLNRDYHDLMLIITKEFHFTNLKNAELCFLIYNFYMLLDRQIPIEIESSFISISDYNSLRLFETSFEEKGMQHPMILTLTYKNFIISYISQKLCDYLGYKKTDLQGEDFHRLLPNEISAEHSLMIKKFLLYDKRCFIKKDTFAIAKNGYFFPLRITASFLPGLSENTYIADLQPAHSEMIDRERSLLIVLDRRLDLITLNEEFEDKFFMSLEMLKRMEVSMVNLFGITENQINTEFKNSLEHIENQHEHWDSLVEIFKCQDLRTVLQDEKKLIEINKNKLNQNEEKLEEKRSKFGSNYVRTKTFYRRKNAMIPYLQKLLSVILENEYPKEWLTKVSDLEKTLFKYNSSMKYTSSNNNMSKTSPNDLLKIEVQLRNIVNLPYYLIRMWDSEKSSLESVLVRDSNFKRSILPSSPTRVNEENQMLVNKNLKKKATRVEEESNENSSMSESERTLSNVRSDQESDNERQESMIREMREIDDKLTKKNNGNKKKSILFPHENFLEDPKNNNVPLIINPKTGFPKKFKLTELKINDSGSIPNTLNVNESGVDHSSQNLISSIQKINPPLNNKFLRNNSRKNSHKNLDDFKLQAQPELRYTNSIFSYNENDDKNVTHRTFRRRVEIKKEIKKNKKTLVNFLLLITTLMLLNFISIYNVFFSTQKLNNSQNLFQVNYNAMALKSAVTYTGLGVITSCLKSGGHEINVVDGFNSTLKELQNKLSIRAKEMYIFVYRLRNYLHEAGAIPEVQGLYDIMNTYQPYSLLSENWQIYDRNSTLFDEIDYYHYYIANLENDGMWGSCNIDPKGIIKSSKTANFGEKASHYVLENLLTKMNTIFRKLTTLSGEILTDYHTNSIIDLAIYNSSIIFVFVALGIFIIISIIQYKRKINSVLRKLFEIKQEDNSFERKLSNFKNILTCLDRSVGEEYEEVKLSLTRESTLKKQKDLTQGVSTTVNNTNFNNATSSNLLTHLNNNSSLNLNSKKESQSDVKKQEAKKKEKERAAKDYENLKEQENNLLNDSHKENFEDYFYISFVKRSFAIIFIFNLAYFVLVSVNIITNINDFNNILFANRVAMNFLDRVPRYGELILYYKVSILTNNVNFFSRPHTEYESISKFVNVFNTSTNFKDNTLYTTLPESGFSYLMYLLKLERNNIKNFMDVKYEGILPSVRKFENLINSKEACLHIAIYNEAYLNNRKDDKSDYVNFYK